MAENLYRATKDFDWHDASGASRSVRKGELIDVLSKLDLAVLLDNQFAVPCEAYAAILKASGATSGIDAIEGLAPGRKRIVFTLPTSTFFSGGRIHIFQVAAALANAGNDVIYSSNRRPRWADEYPGGDKITFTEQGYATIPDVDLVVADGKNPCATKALAFCKANAIPFVIWNFETPNWFGEFCPELAEKIAYHDNYIQTFREADLAIANSGESARYLREWIGRPDPPIAIIRPAVNTSKLEGGVVPAELAGRRYAVISGRSDAYKRNDLSFDAVFDLPEQCDLVAIGRTSLDRSRSNDLHRLIVCNEISDADKYALMRGAVAVLHPSRFEGFGMVPAEALAVGTPVVVFDLPVYRAEYGDRLHYAPREDYDGFKRLAQDVITSAPSVPPESSAWSRTELGLDALARTVESTPYHHTSEVHISAVLNAYRGAATLPFALESVYDGVDEILVSYGRESAWEWREDGTLAALEAFPDPDNKIKIIYPPGGGVVWPGATKDIARRKMRTAGVRRAAGNYLLILDADEIWEGFNHYVDALRSGSIVGGCPLAVTYWHNKDFTIRSDRLERWGLRNEATEYGVIWPHVRVIPWRASYKWRSHVSPKGVSGEKLWRPAFNLATVAELGDRCVLHHLGHAFPRSFMEEKKAFYTAIEGQRRAQDAWLNWDGRPGVCPDGIVERRTFELPEIVERAFSAIESSERG